jgi:transitional endoplasmic reticulum ATPase
VIVVGATNRPELIDPAVLRSGRFDLLLDLPLPDRQARRAIYDIYTKRRPLAQNVSLDTLAKRSDGLSGADIEFVCRRAANLSVSEWMRANGAEALSGAQSSAQAGIMRLKPPVIEMRHFEQSIASARNETGGKWG